MGVSHPPRTVSGAYHESEQDYKLLLGDQGGHNGIHQVLPHGQAEGGPVSGGLRQGSRRAIEPVGCPRL